MSSLVDRAARALRHVREINPNFPDHRSPDADSSDARDELHTRRLRAQLTRDLAAVLGVDIANHACPLGSSCTAPEAGQGLHLG